jgi:hypothetical protein
MQAYTNLAAILSLVGLTKPKQHNRYTIGKLSQALRKYLFDRQNQHGLNKNKRHSFVFILHKIC